MTTNGSLQRRTKRSWFQRSAGLFRWLHIYLSMASFTSLMFFAFTGITLNHPTWFGAAENELRDTEGVLPAAALAGDIDKLQVVEKLRAEHSLKGQVQEFNVDEAECMIIFKSPGYAADVFIDRASGKYTITETISGAMAIMNDLHKGRDSGAGWSWVIDFSAVLMLLVSVSGFVLLFYLKKRLVSGLVTAMAGTMLLIAAWVWFVP